MWINQCGSTSFLPHFSQCVLVIVIWFVMNDSCELHFVEIGLSGVWFVYWLEYLFSGMESVCRVVGDKRGLNLFLRERAALSFISIVSCLRNNIGDSGTSSLSEALKVNSSLTHLNLNSFSMFQCDTPLSTILFSSLFVSILDLVVQVYWLLLWNQTSQSLHSFFRMLMNNRNKQLDILFLSHRFTVSSNLFHSIL